MAKLPDAFMEGMCVVQRGDNPGVIRSATVVVLDMVAVTYILKPVFLVSTHICS